MSLPNGVLSSWYYQAGFWSPWSSTDLSQFALTNDHTCIPPTNNDMHYTHQTILYKADFHEPRVDTRTHQTCCLKKNIKTAKQNVKYNLKLKIKLVKIKYEYEVCSFFYWFFYMEKMNRAIPLLWVLQENRRHSVQLTGIFPGQAKQRGDFRSLPLAS